MRIQTVSNSSMTGSIQQRPLRNEREQQAKSRLALKVAICAGAVLLAGIALYTLKPGALAESTPVSDGVCEYGFSPDPFYLFSQKYPIPMRCLEKTVLRDRCFNSRIKGFDLKKIDRKILVESVAEYLDQFKKKAEDLEITAEEIKCKAIYQYPEIDAQLRESSRSRNFDKYEQIFKKFIDQDLKEWINSKHSRLMAYQNSERDHLNKAFEYLTLEGSKNVAAASLMIGKILTSKEWLSDAKNKRWLYFPDKMFRNMKLFLKDNPEYQPNGTKPEDLEIFNDRVSFHPPSYPSLAHSFFKEAVRSGNADYMRKAADAFHNQNRTSDGTPDPHQREFLEMAADHCHKDSQRDMIQIATIENNATARTMYWDLYLDRIPCAPRLGLPEPV